MGLFTGIIEWFHAHKVVVPMQCGEAGIKLAKSYEQLRLEAYKAAESNPDGSAKWAIGWGTTHSWVTEDMACTEAQADAWFAQDMAIFANALSRMIAPILLSQNQFDALCDFVYNAGPGTFAASSILALIKKDSLGQVPAHLLTYDKMKVEQPDGTACLVVSDGLQKRRKEEAVLWNMSDS